MSEQNWTVDGTPYTSIKVMKYSDGKVCSTCKFSKFIPKRKVGLFDVNMMCLRKVLPIFFPARSKCGFWEPHPDL